MSMWKDWLSGLSWKKTTGEKKEIGRGAEGELSVDELRAWLAWSVTALGICLVIVCVMAAVSAVRSRKEAAILEVDSGEVLEFYLNRKGAVLKAKGDAAGVLNDHSLEEGVEEILQALADYGHLGDNGAVIFTLRPSEAGVSADLERFAEEIHVYAEAFLSKRHSNGTVYVNVLENDASLVEAAESYGVSLGKAALVQDLVDENLTLRRSDVERLLKMPLDDVSAEIAERKYDTSFIVVIAKQVFAYVAETEAETASEEEMQETEAVKEETKAEVPKKTETGKAATVESREETGAESLEPESESAEDGSEAAESVGNTEMETVAESGAQEEEGTAVEEEVPSEAEMDTAGTQSETAAGMEETSMENGPGAVGEHPETSPEITVPETSGTIQPEVQPTQPQPESTEPAPTVPETQAPVSTQPTGSIIEQVIPLTPAG